MANNQTDKSYEVQFSPESLSAAHHPHGVVVQFVVPADKAAAVLALLGRESVAVTVTLTDVDAMIDQFETVPEVQAPAPVAPKATGFKLTNKQINVMLRIVNAGGKLGFFSPEFDRGEQYIVRTLHRLGLVVTREVNHYVGLHLTDAGRAALAQAK